MLKVCFSIDQQYIKPNNQKIAMGKVAQISCRSDNQASWFFNGRDLPDNVMSFYVDKKSTIVIIKASKENVGTYECISKIQSSNGVWKTFRARSTLEILG